MATPEEAPGGSGWRRALGPAFAIYAVDSVLAWRGVGYPVRVAAALLLAWLGGRLAGVVPLVSWGRGRVSLRHAVRVVGVSAAVCTTLLAGAVLWVRASGAGPEQVPIEARNVLSLDRFWPWFVVAVVFAPIAEELVYRGCLQPFLRSAFGPAGAIALSGFLFWTYHWWMWGAVTPVNHLIGGWILAWSCERTRSLLAPTLLHALGNLALGLGDVLWLARPDLVRGILGWV